MIRETIYINKYDWTIHCYFAVTGYYVTQIVSKMLEIGSPRGFANKAYRMLCYGEMDSGLTYSNEKRRESVLVTSLTHDASEFINTLSHEAGHVVQHICTEDGIDMHTEESCYMLGDICQELYPYCKNLLCCQCH